MDDKITFQDLIDAIAEQSGRSKQFTHDFIKDFASLVKEGLEKNGSVNIAGLGKFELKKMDERQGYNPETEENITIPAHNKIDFTPYKDLSELVNAPYAHMEPEVLEEEVNSSSSDEQNEEQENRESEEPENGGTEEATEKQNAPWKEDMESEIEVDEDDPFGLDAGRKTSQASSAAGMTGGEDDREDRSDEEDEDVVEFSKEYSSETEQESDVDDEKDSGEAQIAQPAEPVAVSNADSKSFKAKPKFRDRSHRRKDTQGTFWIIAAAFIILLLAIVAWYFMGSQQEVTPETSSTATTEVDSRDQSEPQGPAAAEQEQDSEPAESTTGQDPANNSSEPEPAADASQSGADNRQAAAQNGQPVDPDTPAPVETITVSAGQTLWGLADDEYQNPYLWPWIYDTNQPEIDDPDLIYAGQLLDIPKRRGQNNELSNNDSLQVALGYVETYLWYKENNLDNARFYLYAAKKYHNRVFEYTDATFDEDDLRFANRAR
ncbi:MAG: HU family DNA-binding protein [Balneolaceae bacterium]|nr:HU family DNA-binding protein [Balneolaceae bacterium]